MSHIHAVEERVVGAAKVTAYSDGHVTVSRDGKTMEVVAASKLASVAPGSPQPVVDVGSIVTIVEIIIRLIGSLGGGGTATGWLATILKFLEFFKGFNLPAPAPVDEDD